jgi:predicted transcriptional regulator
MNMGYKKLNSKENIHKLGVNYICNFLERAGFTIHEVHDNPEHHFQLLAKVNERSLLIAVRTANYPDTGSIDKKTTKRLIKEAELLNAVPHFAGLTIKPSEINDASADGLSEGQRYNVIFSGISVIRKSE